jgi:MoaA/NifB/PqqE/SkfB family radical SAM enzyme
MIEQSPKNSIAGWFFTPEEIASTLSNGHMLNPSIDLSNPCNLNCPYCYIEEKNSARKVRKPNELTHQEIVAVIDDLQSCGAKTINIVGAGEPTIDPHFEEVIEAINHRGLTTVLFTNGIRFYHQPDLVEFLYQHNVSVVLKYNSISAEVQDLVAGRNGYTEKRNAALDHLLDAGFTAYEPTRLGVDIMVFQGNIDEIPAIHRWCRTQNIFPIAGEFIPTGRTENGGFQGYSSLEGLSESQRDQVVKILQPISDDERRALINALSDIDTSFGIRRPGQYAYFGGGICTQILGLYIDIEGNVWPCVAKKKGFGAHAIAGLIGNVRNGDKPSALWRTDAYLKLLREKFTGGCPYKLPLT